MLDIYRDRKLESSPLESLAPLTATGGLDSGFVKGM